MRAIQVLPLPILAFACAIRQPDLAPMESIEPEQQARFEELSVQLGHALFDRDTVPAPTLSFAAQTREQDGVRVTVEPALAERQPWNAWPDGTARLFNDGVGFLWRVRIESSRVVQWSPAHTSLAVNDTDQIFSVASLPDEVLAPLLQGAALEAALGARGDLALRARNADDFRRAYLTARSGTGQEGFVMFPAPTRSIHTVAMELRLGLVLEDVGLREFRFLFE